MKTNRLYKKIIIALSIAIPLLVALLIFTPFKLGMSGDWISSLPMLNAFLNSTTALCLIIAVIAVKNQNIKLHSTFMLFGLILGACFLLSYVLYHSNAVTVKYGDINHDGIIDPEELLAVGNWRLIYLVVLLSHIGFSIIVVPLVLFAFYYALTDKINQHKKLVKFTFPIWLYVSVTGVIVYFMISPYYI